MRKKIITIIALLALVAVLGITMMACSETKNISPTRAKENLEAANYFVKIYTEKDSNENDPEGRLTYYSATSINKNDKSFVRISFFESSATASNYYLGNDFRGLLDSYKEDAEEEGWELEYGKSGKCVYIGTKNAVSLIK